MADSTISLNGWNKLAGSNPAIHFIDVTLRGCAQVMFQNNPLTGLFFFAAIFTGAYSEGLPAVAWGCLLGTVVSTLTAYISKLDTGSLSAGLYGYNGCLVGVALPTFLENTPFMWASIVLGSIVAVIATISLTDFLKNWKVAALTAPFVLVTWTILLASYSFFGIKGVSLPEPALPVQYVAPVDGIPYSDLLGYLPWRIGSISAEQYYCRRAVCYRACGELSVGGGICCTGIVAGLWCCFLTESGFRQCSHRALLFQCRINGDRTGFDL